MKRTPAQKQNKHQQIKYKEKGKEKSKKKNIENMDARNDMEMEAVAGGKLIDFLPTEPVFGSNPFQPIDLGDGAKRPRPLPQNRRGNKAP